MHCPPRNRCGNQNWYCYSLTKSFDNNAAMPVTDAPSTFLTPIFFDPVFSHISSEPKQTKTRIKMVRPANREANVPVSFHHWISEHIPDQQNETRRIRGIIFLKLFLCLLNFVQLNWMRSVWYESPHLHILAFNHKWVSHFRREI